ncbi:MAG: DUF11 domain-containing protein [Flavobacteriales bacterium]|nr:DUF11 domain-containing protein [Flavobacteriales bacterium]MBP6698799.1 DUF11 domain-containing protein [Flavobacteriales bacterium]
MYKTSALLIAFLALQAQAQLCNQTANPMPDGQDFNLIHGVHREGGGGLTLTLYNTATGPVTTRWSPTGQVMWNRNFKHMDPTNNWALPGAITSTSNGGALITGKFWPQQAAYENMYAAQIDANGNTVWARIYMLDSVPEMNPDPRALIELPGGGYLFPIYTNQGLSLSKLDADAIPVWTKRYRVGVSWQSVLKVFVENNGDITMVATVTSPSSTHVIRLDPDGNLLWKRSWPFLGFCPVHSMNGEIILAGDDGGANWFLTRIDAQGGVLWRHSYPYYHIDQFLGEGVRELSNGHVLLYGEGVLLETDANGAYVGQWSAGVPGLAARLLLARQPHGDTLMIASDDYSGSSVWTNMLTSSSTADLACAGTAVTGSSTLLTTPIEITGDPLTIVQDSLKTWTMNFSPASAALDLDPIAHANAERARPGFTHQAYGVINNGSLLTTGPITATMTIAPEITYVSADPAPQSVTGQTISWQLPALGPNSLQILTVELTTPPDPLLIGTSIPYTFSFTQDSSETSLANNTSTIDRTIVGAYDPNTKEVVPSPYYHIANDSILEYTIHFQNTGNAEATTVVLRDTLPEALDVQTFRLGAMSHTCTYSLTAEGIVTFTFDNINLPDSNSNEAGSHGLVSFRIKPDLPLTLGQEITNRADIYFDFNPAIRTPDATVIVHDMSVAVPQSSARELQVFPVPVADQLNVMVPEGYVPHQAWAIGLDGRRVPLPLLASGNGAGTLRMDVRKLASGAYVLTLVDRSGRRSNARFTKE